MLLQSLNANLDNQRIVRTIAIWCVGVRMSEYFLRLLPTSHRATQNLQHATLCVVDEESMSAKTRNTQLLTNVNFRCCWPRLGAERAWRMIVRNEIPLDSSKLCLR